MSALRSALQLYRDSKLKLPETKFSTAFLKAVNEIDPNNQLSAREICEKLKANPDVLKELQLNDSALLSETMLRDYAETYFQAQKKLLADTTAEGYDMFEYQTQQLISVMGVNNLPKFIACVQELADKDGTCPYVLKKSVGNLVSLVVKTPPPTSEQERLAERIITLVDPSLEGTKPEVFRALVDSLKWQKMEDLKRTHKAVIKTPPEKRHIKGRESCIFIESADSAHYIG